LKEILGGAGFGLDFDLVTGLCPRKASTKRYLSGVKSIFLHPEQAEERLKKEDPLVYEFYELEMIQDPGDLAFGTSIVHPGRVGGEYFMTKGHFHSVLATAEVYLCLRGKGMMMMESPEGDWDCQELYPGRAVYVPKRLAHRSINVGEEPLVTFFTFRAEAGHDYGTIERQGFRKLVMERGGRPEVVDNPRWKDGGGDGL